MDKAVIAVCAGMATTFAAFAAQTDQSIPRIGDRGRSSIGNQDDGFAMLDSIGQFDGFFAFVEFVDNW